MNLMEIQTQSCCDGGLLVVTPPLASYLNVCVFKKVFASEWST